MASKSGGRKRSGAGNFKRLADGRIRVRVSHGYDLDGKQRRVTAYAKNMEDAERLAVALSAELGKKPDLGRGLTLASWWGVYQTTKGARLAKSTLNRYEGDMRRTWLPALGKVDISLITRRDVQAVLIDLPTKSYAQHALRSLSAVLTQAVREGHLSTNPLRDGGFELPGDVGAKDVSGVDYSEDPFAAIEGSQTVWDAQTVIRALEPMRGVPLETCWLAMVGAGLRREEALALLWKDVRRVTIDGREVTQIAVYKAYTAADGLKRTKTERSVRIVAVVEPFGSRLWELRGKPESAVVEVSVHNVHHRWRTLFEPVTSKHAKTKGRWKGRLYGFPFVPLSRMRATHETFMQQAGVLDSVNAAAHGHSERISYAHYQRADGLDAARQAGEFLVHQGGKPQNMHRIAQ